MKKYTRIILRDQDYLVDLGVCVGNIETDRIIYDTNKIYQTETLILQH
jgi:hypothetical protein